MLKRMEPKVSVIIPIYNVEKYLNRCVDSVLTQTLKEIEVILVDDESPDNSPQMCDEYAQKDERIRVIHKKNGGLGLARNSGLDIAKGDFVAFLDSDDYIEKDALEILYNTCIGKKVEICYGSYLYEMKDGRTIKKQEVKQPVYYYGKEETRKFLLDMVGPLPEYSHDVKYAVSVCKGLYKRSLFEEYHFRFDSEKNIASEDFLFHIRFLVEVNSVAVIPFYFYHYCENSASITHTYSEEKFQRIAKSMVEVEKRLSEVFDVSDYMIHYQRCLFLSLRGVLSHEIKDDSHSFSQKLSFLKKRCSVDVYQPLFNNYPYWKLDKTKRFLYLAMKYRKGILIYMILRIKEILKK